jgi:hypothetical protein
MISGRPKGAVLVQELDEEMESRKQAWLKKQRSARDRSRGTQSKEVQALNRQLQAALQVLDVERYHAAACEEAAMAADRALHKSAPLSISSFDRSSSQGLCRSCIQPAPILRRGRPL